VVTHLLSATSTHVSEFSTQPSGISALLNPVLMDQGLLSFALLVVSVVLMCGGNYLRKRVRVQAQPVWIRWSLYYTLVLALIYLSVYSDVGFVYFQF
jgi:hypothetical protein